MIGGRAAWGALALAAACALACRREAPVATLLARTGTVERGDGKGWRDAVPGSGFVVGDTLRTAAASSARLRVSGGGVVRVGENGRLRFRRSAAPGENAPDIAVDLGSAEFDEAPVDISLITPAGPARIQRGGRVRVRADGQTSTLEVLVGRAVMIDAGREVAVDAGQGIRIRLGSAEIQHFSLKVEEAVVEPNAGPPQAVRPDAGETAATAAPPDAGATPLAGARAADEKPAAPAGADEIAGGGAGSGGRGTRADNGRADVTITAGESATLHDGRPPLAVRVRFDRLCPGDAVLELGGHGHHGERLVGAGAVVLRLRPGTQPYRVRCAGDGRKDAPRATGVLSLRRDTGYLPLPRRAPANVIDADGRRYTVMFQTRLPQLTLAWPGAPAGATGLQLHLESPAGERVVAAANPRRPLPAGTLQEGTYTWWYTTGDNKQSPRTTLSIRFDNAAPTAQFFRVSSGGAHGAIPVDGVTVDGAKVSVAGQPLEVDGRGRFRAEVSPLAGDDAVAVRLEHPRTGVHYYVRRRSGPH